MQILITTSDDYVHLMPGFIHQWNKYCGLDVAIVYRNVKPIRILEDRAPTYAIIHSEARFFEWSTSLLNALWWIKSDIILLGLEDYWLSGDVNHTMLLMAEAYMQTNPDVMRIDLTEDRGAYPHTMRDGYYQAVINPEAVEYVLSTQFSLWRKDFLMHALEALNPPGLPPQFEVEASRVVAREQPVILGTQMRVLPCHGDGVVWNGRTHDLHLEYLKPEDVDELKRLGYA